MNWFYSVTDWLGLGGLKRLFGKQYPTPTGYANSPAKPVNFDSAMQVSAFWACVKLIAESVACLPLTVYRTNGRTRVEDTEHSLARLLLYKPNQYQTRIEFFETLILNLAVWGNAYVRIDRVAGEIVSLMPLMSAQVQTELLRDGSVVHIYTNGVDVQVFASSSIWHIKLFGNGIVGLSPLSYARNAVAIAQASEDRVTSIFRNGAKPTGVLMVDSSLNKEQRQQIRESFADLAEGNSDSLIVLDKFMKYEQVSMSPQDIELLQSRKFQIEDIARFMGVPSVLINDTSQSTAWGSGIQQLIQGWYKLGLRPYLERIELSAQVHLLPVSERRQIELAFNFDALLRADSAGRAEANQKRVNAGLMTPNEGRADDGLPPLPGGDQLFIQGAMVPIELAGRPKQTGVQNGA